MNHLKEQKYVSIFLLFVVPCVLCILLFKWSIKMVIPVGLSCIYIFYDILFVCVGVCACELPQLLLLHQKCYISFYRKWKYSLALSFSHACICKAVGRHHTHTHRYNSNQSIHMMMWCIRLQLHIIQFFFLSAMKYNVKTLLFSRQMHCYAEESQQTHHPIECKHKHKQKKKIQITATNVK